MHKEKIPIADLMRRYTTYCKVIRNYRHTTLTGYQNTFKLLLKETKAVYLEDLTKHVIENWFFNGRLKRKWSAVTFRSYHKVINCFFKWLVKEGYIEHNFVKEIEKPRLEKKLPRTLSHNDAKLLLDASFHLDYRYRFERYRNRAVIGIMLLAGLRKSEVVNLMRGDVDLENRSIFINQGKGGKDRVIPINSHLEFILSEYLKDRKRLNAEIPELFISLYKDKSFGGSGVKKLIDRLRNKTKLNFSAHTLRHSFATLMLEGGCDIYTLSKIMGHNKITTTTIYLSCSNQQMGKAIEMHSLN